jgi:type I restriction-modification system DNA methylase subunit
MALSLNKPKLDNLAGDIWKSAERLCGKFKAYDYQSVILPIIDGHVSIYDPTCRTGGMLSVAKEHLLERATKPAQRDNIERFVTGQRRI